jgi:hypothetical protein
MNTNELPVVLDGNDPAPTEEVLAWEEIASGRYMPRRIRGSFRGRVLG